MSFTFHHDQRRIIQKKRINYCSQNETVAVKMPPKNSSIFFKNYFKKFHIPFIVYEDFERFTKPINSCEPDSNNCFTMEYQKHEPSGFCLHLKELNGTTDDYGKNLYYLY